MLGAARTRVHASHGGAHGPENRREKVPKRAQERERPCKERSEEERDGSSSGSGSNSSSGSGSVGGQR